MVVWLGPERDASGEVFRFIREKRSFPDLDDPDEEALESFLDTYRTPVLGFVNLTEREWFRRVWCIQEYALAQKAVFQCGHDVVPMVDLYNLLSLCMRHSITTQFALAYFTKEATDASERLRIPGLHRFDKLSKLHQRSRARLLRGNDDATNAHESALSLLTEFKGWSVTDARDRIFC